MSRPIPNADPRTERTNSSSEPVRVKIDSRHWVYVTWQARDQDGRTLDYAKTHPCQTWHEGRAKTQELERLMLQSGWPAVDAFNVQVDGPGLVGERVASPEGRAEIGRLCVRVRSRADARRDDETEVF